MTSRTMIFQIVVAMSTLFGWCHARLFLRSISPSDPDLAKMFLPLQGNPIPAPAVGSALECAGYALMGLDDEDKAKSISAFHFENDLCQLGRIPPFVDLIASKPVLLDESGINSIFLEKPVSAIAHADLHFYVLLNEEKAFAAHMNLPDPKTSYYDGTTKRFDYIMESPVQTLEGQFAATPVNGAVLEYALSSRSYSQITAMVWYNSGPAWAQDDILVTLGKPALLFDHAVRFYAGTSQGNLHVTIYNVVLISGLPQERSTANSVVPQNTWCYVGFSYDGDAGRIFYIIMHLNNSLAPHNPYAGEVVFYLNGTAIDTKTFANNGLYSRSLNNLNVFSIGEFNSAFVASVEVYDSVLSPAQVAEAMEKSLTTRVTV